MTIGPAITAALPDLRAQALSLMTSTATITRGTGEPVWDPVLEEMSDGAATIYDGPARLLRISSMTGRPVDAAGESVVVTPYTLTLPWDTEGIEDGDRIEVDGMTLWAKWIAYGTHRVELRVGCAEYA